MNPKVHTHVHKSQFLDLGLSLMNPAHIFTYYFFNVDFDTK
jgi:hypothetical protein